MSAHALVSLLFWRKWLFDLDNRAGQETGYVFEPIVARCVGGEPYGAKKSPVHRKDRPSEGRQVDCVFENRAYEIKLRVTIAASGQGRWGEEKEFPVDCKASGYLPFLLVFDDTQADKLDELASIFRREGGEVFVGEDAWSHLEELAGPTMSTFLELYVREPLKDLLDNTPARDALPPLRVSMSAKSINIQIGEEILPIRRPSPELLAQFEDEISDLDRASES